MSSFQRRFIEEFGRVARKRQPAAFERLEAHLRPEREPVTRANAAAAFLELYWTHDRLLDAGSHIHHG